jgi:hypothetical protein
VHWLVSGVPGSGNPAHFTPISHPQESFLFPVLEASPFPASPDYLDSTEHWVPHGGPGLTLFALAGTSSHPERTLPATQGALQHCLASWHPSFDTIAIILSNPSLRRFLMVSFEPSCHMAPTTMESHSSPLPLSLIYWLSLL